MNTISARPLQKLFIRSKNKMFRHFSNTRCIKSEKIEDEVLIKRLLTSHHTCLPQHMKFDLSLLRNPIKTSNPSQNTTM